MAALLSCSKAVDDQPRGFAPSEVIDLGASVTEDLPQRMWGKVFLKQMNFTKQNEFNVIAWKFPVDGDTISGSNAYYTLFNHGGPHVDAPNHVGAGGGIGGYLVVEADDEAAAIDQVKHGLVVLVELDVATPRRAEAWVSVWASGPALKTPAGFAWV
jgi:hypothetical protein